MEKARFWWDQVTLARGEQALWKIGPLCLLAQRREREWILRWGPGDDRHDSDARVSAPFSGETPNHLENLSRFGFKSEPERIRVLPILADRSIISRPEDPFYVLPGEEVELFLSSPLWVRAELEKAGPLQELPMIHPSDTWFGPTIHEGELSYASLTAARQRHEDVSLRPHRAVTAVTIRNKGKDTLLLERINLPVPNLSLFHTEDGYLCTEAVCLERYEQGEMAKVSLEAKPHAEAKRPTLIASPRVPVAKNFVLRAFNTLRK